ncbi:MAG: TatD family hydrolase [Verrucomicrobiales bacterium]
MLIDSHCHLASHRFPSEEVCRLVERAREAGVHQLVTLATGMDDLETNLELARRYPEVHACLGIHPCDVQDSPDDFAETLRPLLSAPQVAAVGETGLDYYHPAPAGWDDSSLRARQATFLDQHFELAAQAGLNLVIHTRDKSGTASFEEALAIYQNHAKRVRAVFHCFVGTFANAHRVLELGGLVSFGGVATFKNAREVLEVVTQLDPGSFMLETDSPYLAPHPHRGSRNEPAFTRVIAEKIAMSRAESLEELAQHTTKTAREFFRGLE